MKIRIQLQDKKEIETEIEAEDYEELKESLIQGKIKFLNFEDKLLKTSLIGSIEPVKEVVSKEFRLPEPEFQSVDSCEGMKRLFNLLKLKGLFQEYESYEEWCGEKYREKV